MGSGENIRLFGSLKAKNEKAKAAFSYVSLYGISTVDEIYTRIALGWHNNVTKKAPEWMKELAGHGGKTIRGIAAFLNAGELFDAVGTAAVGLMARNTLVVIDDLERRDDALSIKAAMGVITHLVESRNCRVVLISNDRMLEGEEEKNEFERQKEKIFDIEMEYAPTVEENASLIPTKESELILPVLSGLEIRNIRVIRRVIRAVDYFSRHLVKIPAPVRQAFLKNVAVISALHHGFRDRIDFSQLKTALSIPLGIAIFREERDLSETEKLLAKVAFAEGPADDEILAYLQGGWIDISALQQELAGKTAV